MAMAVGMGVGLSDMHAATALPTAPPLDVHVETVEPEAGGGIDFMQTPAALPVHVAAGAGNLIGQVFSCFSNKSVSTASLIVQGGMFGFGIIRIAFGDYLFGVPMAVCGALGAASAQQTYVLGGFKRIQKDLTTEVGRLRIENTTFGRQNAAYRLANEHLRAQLKKLETITKALRKIGTHLAVEVTRLTDKVHELEGVGASLELSAQRFAVLVRDLEKIRGSDEATAKLAAIYKVIKDMPGYKEGDDLPAVVGRAVWAARVVERVNIKNNKVVKAAEEAIAGGAVRLTSGAGCGCGP
jgi:hypothetical protein